MPAERTVTVSLPEDLDRFILDEVSRGVSASRSDYVRTLIAERYAERQAEER